MALVFHIFRWQKSQKVINDFTMVLLKWTFYKVRVFGPHPHLFFKDFFYTSSKALRCIMLVCKIYLANSFCLAKKITEFSNDACQHQFQHDSMRQLRVQNEQFSEEKGFILRYTEKEV